MQDSSHTIPSKEILISEWQKTFGRPAPSGCHTSFLDKAIAWQKQVMKHGGLSAAERRRLLGGNAVAGQESQNIGARLIRVWQDQTHQVTILEDGFDYDGKRWTSLSAIAKAITGTPWSGPAFFGVKKS